MKLLNTNASNPKILKSQTGTEYNIASLSLMPNDQICAARLLAECADPCLVQAARGAFPNVQQARMSKSDFWHQDKAGFLELLKTEIKAFRKKCHAAGKEACFRLNTFSDIPYEKLGIPQAFGDCLFYDYTKIAGRLGRTPANYHLTFSYSAAPQYQKSVAMALKTDAPVAVVFRGFVPVGDYYLGREIIDGDKSDLINMKAKGQIVGLRLKGQKSVQESRSPFIVSPYDAAAMERRAA
jgi:hypothetical protein